MNRDFQRLYRQFLDKKVTTIQMLDELKSMHNFSDDLLEALKDQLAASNWSRLNGLLHAVFLVPERKFTPFLCILLDNHREESDMEALADLLFEIRDETSVPALIRALDYYLPVDDDFHFNRKVLGALDRIGTDDAVNFVKQSLHNPNELIRETAEHLINQR